MKVLFQNRKRDSWIGGDYIQLDKTVEALRRLGVEVDVTDDVLVKPEKIQEYDIVHLFNFSMPWTKYQLWNARKNKIPVVCSMIYHESDQFINYDLQQIMFNELSAAFFLTKGEVERVKRHITIDDKKVHIIENGIDSSWNTQSDRIVPLEAFGLTVGRIEPNKGQLEVALACYNLNIPYVCIGERTEPGYAALCEETGAIIKDKMSHEELKPWYKSALFYILASEAEIYPLTIMEALSQGTPVILTEHCEWNIPFARCIHGNVENIQEVIHNLPKERVSFPMKSWDDIAIEIKRVYETIHGNRK